MAMTESPRLPQDPQESKVGRISKEAVDSLLKDNSPDAKIKVLKDITSLYNEDAAGVALKETELTLIEDIFRTLVKVAEKEVRVVFSNSIKNSPRLPKDIALALVQDIDDVSTPILQASKVLGESDLMKIINSTKYANQLTAIARREYVSKGMSEALVEKNEEVAETLLTNFGAEISENTYNKILEKSGDSETIIKAMVEKGTMPITVMEKLLGHVNGQMRKDLDEKYHVVFESADVKKEMERGLRDATMRMMGWRTDDALKKKMLRQLSESGRLPPFVALSTGDYTMFEISIARLSRVSLNNVRILLNDRGELGFKGLYEKAQLPDELFEATSVVFQTIQMLDAERQAQHSSQIRFNPEEVIKRMKIVVGTRRIKNLDFLTIMMEHNLKWERPG
jgi:uncharacterized protein (DUF2336 family)